jgi:hypothetical protein
VPYVAAQNFPLLTPVQTLNTAVTPPVYVDLNGEWWDDMGERVRIHYRPASGQYLLFVGYSPFAELAAETDVTSPQMPDELVIAGACWYLYDLYYAGESASAQTYYLQQRQRWHDYYEELKRRFSMPAIPWELHHPRARPVRGVVVDLGPINP